MVIIDGEELIAELSYRAEQLNAAIDKLNQAVVSDDVLDLLEHVDIHVIKRLHGVLDRTSELLFNLGVTEEQQ